MAQYTSKYKSFRSVVNQYDPRSVATGSDDNADPASGDWYACEGCSRAMILVVPNANVTNYDMEIHYYTGGEWEELESAAIDTQTAQYDEIYEFHGSAERFYVRIFNVTGASGSVQVHVTFDWRT